jgi:hypothetical protein
MATDEQIGALEGGYRRLSEQVKTLTGDIATVNRAVAALVRGQAEKEPAPLAPSLVGAPEAAVVDLLDWLAEVYLQYDGSTLAPCWAWHPGVVEELAVLRGIHRVIYDAADWVRLGDWHDRYRPGVVRRVGQALAGCDISRHAEPQPPVVPLADALVTIYAARAAKAPIPAPSEAQTADARALSSRTKSTR